MSPAYVNPELNRQNNNTMAAVAITIAVLAVGGIAFMVATPGKPPQLAVAGPAQVTVGGDGVAVSVPVTTATETPSPAAMAAEKARFERDRDAMKKQKPQSEADVERVLGRKADQCLTQGDESYCHWFYATKPPMEGRTVLAVMFKNGRVFMTDM